MTPDPAEVQSNILRSLRSHPWSAHVHVLARAASSNDELLQLARSGAPHGTSLLVLDQTSGRGRQGRTWSARAGDSLCLSVLLRQGNALDVIPRLTLSAGLTVHRTLTQLTGLPLHIKWPNDILWESRKLAGILTESGSTSGRIDFAVVGMGINLNQTPLDFPPELRDSATSLHILTGRCWDPAEVTARVVESFERTLGEPWPGVLAAWKEHCPSLGGLARVATPGGELSGRLLDIDTDGAILLQLPGEPQPRRLVSAEIL
jgi:BirA family biotin operon repressor/biotin-[acetyl-CoA-carboxylase] ligase